MSTVIEILRGLVALFVDDELLAVGVLGIVGVTAVLIMVAGVEPLAAGAVLLGGNVVVLMLGAIRTARRTDRV
jgi:hypothetical protein